MTVNQAIALLQRIAREGHGELPFCAIDGCEDTSECNDFTIGTFDQFEGEVWPLEARKFTRDIPCVIAGTWCVGREFLPEPD